MKATVLILFSILLSSCVSKINLNKDGCTNQSGISDSLYNLILTYQEKNPLPIISNSNKNLPPPPETAFRYIYEVQFKKEQDTIITITLRPDGISFNEQNRINIVFGIYEDSCLKPTYIIDNMKLGRGYIVSKRKGLENFEYDNSSIIDDIYDIYTYKVEKNNFLFLDRMRGSIDR